MEKGSSGADLGCFFFSSGDIYDATTFSRAFFVRVIGRVH